MVGKREDSRYETGSRSKSWLKVKVSQSGEFLICGFTEGTGGRNKSFGSLLLGEYDDSGELMYRGGVGTGFDEKKLAALLKTMTPLITKSCPFKVKPKGKLNPTWLKPELVAEIKYLERTQDNILRAPVYLHLREDIKPGQVKKSAEIHVVSKPGKKVQFTSETKAMQNQPDAPDVHDKGERARGRKKSDLGLSTTVSAALEQLDQDKEKLTLELPGGYLPVTSFKQSSLA